MLSSILYMPTLRKGRFCFAGNDRGFKIDGVGGGVGRETQYFADPLEPGPSSAQWVELML